MLVRVFDETKTSACGEIDLKALISSSEFEVPFAVVDILAVFNLLLGRTWLHTIAGGIPSSLHQRVKFISGNKLSTVMGAEEDVPVSHLHYRTIY